MKGALIPLAMAIAGLALGGGAAHVLAPGAPAEEAEGAAHGEAEAPGPEAEAPGPKAGEHAAAEEAPADHGGAVEKEPGGKGSGGHGSGGSDGDDYVQLDNQFVVPLIEDGRTRALVVLALSLEVDPEVRDTVLAREPRLRDALLRVLFDHSNSGGFSGDFTDEGRLAALRSAMRERAGAVLGGGVRDVLIQDIARQET